MKVTHLCFVDVNYCFAKEMRTESENSYYLKKVKQEPKNSPGFTSDKCGTLSSGDNIVNANKLFGKCYSITDLFKMCY